MDGITNWLLNILGANRFSFFVSYAFHDSSWLKKYLTDAVGSLGARHVMLDHNSLQFSGRQAVENIKYKMKACDVVLFVLSKKGLKSPWVSVELGLVQDMEKPIIALVESKDGDYEIPDYLKGHEIILYKNRKDLYRLADHLNQVLVDNWELKRSNKKNDIVAFRNVAIGIVIWNKMFPEKK